MYRIGDTLEASFHMGYSDAMSEASRRTLVAAAVRVELRRRGMTAADLSNLTGLPADELEARLADEVAFDVDELEMIASALGVDIVTLFGGKR